MKQNILHSFKAVVPCLIIILLLGLTSVAWGEMAKEDVPASRSVKVEVTLPADATPGERPYEIVWSGRK